MTAAVLHRLGMAAITMIGVAVVIFVLLRVAPGDPIAMMISPGASPAGGERFARQCQRGKTHLVGLFERQRGEAGQIEPRRGRAHARRPRQTMRDGDTHIRGTELGNDRSIAEFH